ncbi:50S ribosomal protein L17 [Candidatus Daviesbacteria bacterium RIFCSPHIGHO2_01_FULL_40_11]|uniref:50S ribosomal protein L17 n=1 Tax=Candidatus Daviesbacteria bacterium RIFCSPHIGHO2_01_FULL_40_11 TaxID=1797762 RepID=A0A1F5JL39_9BACT|nr:MAG: 50S ribosomal protein L17 [Candidatus Daviesbacteria bacterium RIFCSPHIGHO2_01_FULL_40_11]OGE63016.1 MAG: 50S ribosomal protein L17 [Candidatus Daviesbacteria bacterium RIFCSPLOWO2_01_FULL_40_27]
MRHRVYGKHLGRNKDQRKTLFKGLVYSLLSHGTIQTSEAKAKAIKGLVDRIINSAKENPKLPGHLVQSFVSDKALQKRLTDEVLPKLGTKSSGFTRMVRLGTRLGDQTTMVRMSLIGSEELKPISKDKVSREERVPRQRRGSLTAAQVPQVEKPRGTAKRKTKAKTK